MNKVLQVVTFLSQAVDAIILVLGLDGQHVFPRETPGETTVCCISEIVFNPTWISLTQWGYTQLFNTIKAWQLL
jgi:hypothetical protein